ncbi:MAG TPA: EamA family transporter [Opitutus sp.]|nr:EamA family transporter [Opitutus sp.]
MHRATPKSPQHTQALLALLLANLCWGLSFPLIKAIGFVHAQLTPGVSSWFITASTLAPRFLLGALVVGMFSLRALRTLTRSELRQGVGLALFSVAGMVFQNDGLLFTSASTSAFLTQLYAITIPVWLALRARRSPSATVWTSCALVVAGVAVLAQLDWRDLRLGRGELETLICSLFFMGQILWLDRAEFANNRALPVTFLMFLLQGLATAGMAVVTAPQLGDLLTPWTSGPWVAFMLTLTLFCTVGAYTLMNAFQPKITATEAGLIYCVEPVFASILALFLPAWLATFGGFDYPNETATASLLIGGGLITAANVLIQLNPPPKAHAP